MLMSKRVVELPEEVRRKALADGARGIRRINELGDLVNEYHQAG